MTASGARSVPSLLDDLARAGIRLRLAKGDGNGNGIEVIAPKGRLTSGLRERITQHKPELIAWLDGTRTARAQDTELPRITHDEENLYEPFAPSDLQMSFIMGGREGFEYYVRPHQYMEYDLGAVDPGRLEKALNQELDHQSKNLVVVRDDLRLQTVRDPAPARVEVFDVRHLSSGEAAAHVERVRDAMKRREPVHDRWPWVDMRVSLLPGDRSKLHYNNNNLFSDAPATLRFINAVLRRYENPGETPPELEISYRDCVQALAELEESPLGQASRKYWTDRIADWPEAPEIPLAGGADPRRRSRLERRELLFPPGVWTSLKEKAAARNLTTTNVLCGVHAEVLAYWSGSRHFLLNNMITHRLPLHPQMSEVFGNFASLYPLEVDWRHEEGFEDRVRRLQTQVLSDVEHVYWSGVKVLQELNQRRRTPGKAVCPYAVGSALFVGAAERPVHSLLETPQTLIDCEFWDLSDGSLWVIWDVIEDMFPPGLIDAMQEGYRDIVTRLAGSEEAWQRRAFEPLPASQRACRAALNAPTGPAPPGLLHDPLPRQAALRPGHPAVIAADGALDYATLAGRAAHLAGRLRATGVRPGDLVAVATSQGWEQVVAVLGALTADAAYVPVDPGWPPNRLRYVLQDTGAAAVLTSARLRETLAPLTGAPVLTVDPPEAGPAPAAAPSETTRRPDDLAYVIYTSGSTGRPKGAMLDHGGPLNTLTEINRRFGVTSDDVLLGISSLCFDLSVYDVFGALDAGATLVLPEPGPPDPASWARTVQEHGVTVWNSVPALMQLFVEEAEGAGLRFPTLRTVLLSGDWIPVGLPDRIRAIAPGARVVSLGGATEASIWSICHPVDHTDPGWVSVPYGKPLANQSWYILDELGREVPDWVAGQLFIGGAGVALGYLGDPEKTASAFVAHPVTGERLYRTGDLGRRLPGGEIEFLGRLDFQVKIQGFRVEPGEVEHALLDLPDVGQAAVVARRTDSGRQLAAFVTAREGAPPPVPAAVQAALGEQLAGYMVPSHLTVLDRLPLTSNGKLDRAALEALAPTDDGAGTHRPAGPGTATERALTEIWQSVLGTARVGIHDDFFDLGGQSFTALRVIGQIARRLDHRVPLGTLLERRTVARLAEWLDARTKEWTPLVRLRASDQAVDPWAFVHPAGGNVLCYRPLAEALDGPFLAFQAPGPATGHQPVNSVPRLAALYAEALTDARPHGPYRIGGWSSGAVIAVEVVRLLEARGEQVERLVVIDSPAPVAPRAAADETQLLLWFLEDLDIGFDPGSPGASEVAGPEGTPVEERLAHALEALRDRGLTGAGTIGAGTPGAASYQRELADTFAVFRAVVEGCDRYSASPVAAGITVLRARDGQVSEFADHPHAEAPDWGWSALTTGAVDSLTVPGTHHTLLTGASVAIVAGALNSPPRRDRPVR
ncbi:amino acid adenylation domain-containing protein [Streptomyces iconiensis]|uniref:Amino acid adenylation domain-containing protein n=1 Tax=Streptomyces iconiensis TaxID=1384038 RepID=A0ABT6ZXA6_9ACTN|nr:amino acid adenylation domain-containing protein [Streptomyces iconiensis]MDJ1133700.1 amino acid adenylation domain-containing protein [Streptomyces iconiensis]